MQYQLSIGVCIMYKVPFPVFAVLYLLICYKVVEGITVTIFGYDDKNNGKAVYLHGDCEPVKNFTELGRTVINNNRWKVTLDLKPCAFQWKWRIDANWENDFNHVSKNRVTSIPDTYRAVAIYSTFNYDDASLHVLKDVAFVLESPPTTSEYFVCGYCTAGKHPFSNKIPTYRFWTNQTCSEPGTVMGNEVIINWRIIECDFNWKWSDNVNNKLTSLWHFGLKADMCRNEDIQINSNFSGPPSHHKCKQPFLSSSSTLPGQTFTWATDASVSSDSARATTPRQKNSCFSKDILVYLSSNTFSVKVEVTGTTKLRLPTGNFTYLQETEEGICQVNIIVSKVLEPTTKCPDNSATVASSTTHTANLSLTVGGVVHTLELPVGVYPYFISDHSHTCRTSLRVYDNQVIRRLDVVAKYKFTCRELMIDSTRQVLQSVIEYRYSDVAFIVHGIANRSVEYKTSYECVNDTLNVTWPTSLVYPADVTSIPSDVHNRITSKITEARNLLEIILLSNIPPILKPQLNSRGLVANPILTSLCKNKRLYSAEKDSCTS